MGLFPEMFGGFQRIDFESFPPCNFIAGLEAAGDGLGRVAR
jgi:hypothetical protein